MNHIWVIIGFFGFFGFVVQRDFQPIDLRDVSGLVVDCPIGIVLLTKDSLFTYANVNRSCRNRPNLACDPDQEREMIKTGGSYLKRTLRLGGGMPIRYSSCGCWASKEERPMAGWRQTHLRSFLPLHAAVSTVEHEIVPRDLRAPCEASGRRLHTGTADPDSAASTQDQGRSKVVAKRAPLGEHQRFASKEDVWKVLTCEYSAGSGSGAIYAGSLASLRFA